MAGLAQNIMTADHGGCIRHRPQPDAARAAEPQRFCATRLPRDAGFALPGDGAGKTSPQIG